jgi:phospholipid-binding lipoprotein MlaA
MSDFTRFTLNSTFGIVGLFDIASEAGLLKHNEDFGQTLGAWGVPSGPYVMLPLLGPSTVRDTAALPLDIKGDPWAYKEPVRWRNVGIALRAVDQRASVLDASNLMEEAALDRYEFIRDGFLQRRQSRITDNGEQKVKELKIPFRKDDKKDDKKDEPLDAKGIKAAYPDDPDAPAAPAAPAGTAAPAAPAAPATPAPPPKADGAQSEAKSIRADYPDDPGPTVVAPSADKKPKAAPAVSSKPASK